MSSDYEYLLYIDEAGDDGLTKVRPIDADGSSEWLIIGGVLIRRKYEHKTVDWIKSIRSDINAVQGPALHYRKLSPKKRLRSCELLAKLPIRGFVVCSNKKNMRGWKNERAASRGGKQWFYNYCIRLLMERVTERCAFDSQKNHGTHKCLKVVFSKRGGHSYSQTIAYWELLKNQSIAGSTFLAKRQIKHQVLRNNLIEYVPHTQVAGLQLADIIASSFYQATNSESSKWSNEPAKKLFPIIAAERQLQANFGVVLQPTRRSDLKLNSRQSQIFEYYGYNL